MKLNHVKDFCTPTFLPVSGFDLKVLADAVKSEHCFENSILSCYSWGQGKPVLFVHGWGSRASHLALMGRLIAGSGFRSIIFDAPAHSSLSKNARSDTSNFFEFTRAIISFTDKFGPFYAIVGHSLGAIASLFAIAGHSRISINKASAEKLVLISLPISIENLIGNYCSHKNLKKHDYLKLIKDLERAYDFSADEFTASAVLKNLNTDVLLIHDLEDEEFSITDINKLIENYSQLKLYTTSGLGHQRIIFNKTVIARIRDHIAMV